MWALQHPTHLGNVPPSCRATPRAINPGLRRQIKSRVKKCLLKISLSLRGRKTSWNADERSETAMSYRFALLHSRHDWPADSAGTSWGTFHSSASGEEWIFLSNTPTLQQLRVKTRAATGSLPPGTAPTIQQQRHTPADGHGTRFRRWQTASRIKVSV